MAIRSQTFKEKFEQLMKVNAEKDAQLDYLRKQCDQAMRNNQKKIRRSHSSSEPEDLEGEAREESIEATEEDERRPR